MLLDPTLTAAYLVLATALALTPGPDVLFVVANGMRHRAKGAVAAALGIGVGSVLHALAAALGVSALIAASPVAFQVLKLAGAAYLFYLGVQALRSFWTVRTGSLDVAVDTGIGEIFRRGMITNILNPKVIIFYLALLPQFVSPELGHVGLQMFLLGSMHNAIGVSFSICVGIGAGRASAWLLKTQFGGWLDAIAGVFFIGLAVRLAVSGRVEP